MYEANYPEILKTCFIINGKYKDPGKDIDVEICQNQSHIVIYYTCFRIQNIL